MSSINPEKKMAICRVVLTYIGESFKKHSTTDLDPILALPVKCV